MRPFGVYVHFPWCAHHCPYCDFAVEVAREIPFERYARAVLAELSARARDVSGLSLRSIYLGGGTPSLQPPGRVADLVAAVRARFAAPAGTAPAPSPGALPLEVTLEANPESCQPALVADWARAGVNRVSVGVQSFDAGVLAKLGRRHGPEVAEQALRAVAAAVPSVAADLIYGARRSSVATARADALRLAALPVNHVSAYALTVEADALAAETPFARLRRQGRLALPPDDEVVAQARAIRGGLRRANLRRYEVSNFARPGFEAVHNRLYWESGSWLGLGTGATGCLPAAEGAGAVRWSNHRSAGAYMAAVEEGRLPTAEEERLTPRQLAVERVMLALRTRVGLPLSELEPTRRAEVGPLVRARLAVVRGGSLTLTSRGLDVHSAVAERLMPDVP